MAYQRPAGCAVVAFAALSFLLAIDCSAQVQRQDHSCTAEAAGSFVFPEGNDGQNFVNGWGLRAGGGFAVSQARGRSGVSYYITANYMYEHLKATVAALDIAKMANPTELANATSAHGSFSAVTIDPTIRYAFNRRLGVYGSGGFGWFRRGVGFDGVNPATLLQSYGNTLDRLSSNSGAFDIGAGGNVGLTKRGGLMLFAEARLYHGTAINSGTMLVPISLGVRW